MELRSADPTEKQTVNLMAPTTVQSSAPSTEQKTVHSMAPSSAGEREYWMAPATVLKSVYPKENQKARLMVLHWVFG
jgi:hypothetical protein